MGETNGKVLTVALTGASGSILARTLVRLRNGHTSRAQLFEQSLNAEFLHCRPILPEPPLGVLGQFPISAFIRL